MSSQTKIILLWKNLLYKIIYLAIQKIGLFFLETSVFLLSVNVVLAALGIKRVWMDGWMDGGLTACSTKH